MGCGEVSSGSRIPPLGVAGFGGGSVTFGGELADFRQPGLGPPGERGEHLRPAGSLRYPGPSAPTSTASPSTRMTRAWW